MSNPQLETINKAYDLKLHDLYSNLSYDDILKAEVQNKEGTLTDMGCINVDTGVYTGRSPQDKYVVKQKPSEDHVWWSKLPPNKSVDPAIFDQVYEDVKEYLADKDVYLYECYCGASAKTHKKIRFIVEYAWQLHFVKNMFIEIKSEEEKKSFVPDMTIINVSKGLVNKRWQEQGLHSEAFVGFNIEKKLGLILAAKYGGEMKKGIFSLMNYWLPLQGVLSMHCSANRGDNGESAVFFGLSGTGKTTLSADPNRFLLGDDEHGWDDDGIFNLEGGCYAKTTNLSQKNEPIIYSAIRKNALLENVWVNEDTSVDFYNNEKTENGRVSYPLEHIPNHEPTSCATHPKNIIFLTCDAYGVLPPVSRLSPGQAMYHYLCGYTAKVAGTERGIKEPVATFSPCFGGAFLLLNPVEYAKLLGEKMQKHNTHAYLVNTGWTGGRYGVGHRMAIPITRRIIDVILTGEIENCHFVHDDLFNLEVPTDIEGIEPDTLIPKNAWEDKEAYDSSARELAGKFVENFKQYVIPGLPDYSEFGVHI
ncbi:hypothetical protein WA158_006633 [Blastocystis sp. Blastoise]